MNPVRDVHQETDGALFSMGSGTLKIQVCSDSIIRVLYSPAASFPKQKDYVVTKEDWPAAKWSMQSTDDAVTVSTSLLKLTITRKDGAIAYADANGAPLVQEASRSMTPEKINGEDTYRAESFINIYGSREALYGLASTSRESGTIAANRSTSLRRIRISPFLFYCRAKATAFSGTARLAAALIIDLPITCTSLPKSPM